MRVSRRKKKAAEHRTDRAAKQKRVRSRAAALRAERKKAKKPA